MLSSLQDESDKSGEMKSYLYLLILALSGFVTDGC